jgi:hypothetical protein
MSLNPELMAQAMEVYDPEATHDTGRAIIDGAVVIYNASDIPGWLQPLLDARDDDGRLLEYPSWP